MGSALGYFNMDQTYVICKAIDLYGRNAQIACVIEELAELQQVLCKYQRGQNPPRERLIEEFGDVVVVLDMLSALFMIYREEIEPVVDAKVQRLSERMKRHGENREG